MMDYSNISKKENFEKKDLTEGTEDFRVEYLVTLPSVFLSGESVCIYHPSS